jgi:hypothetical protein
MRKSSKIKKRVSSERYDHLFSANLETPPVIVDRKIWDAICHSLPPSYCIPDPDFNEILYKELEKGDEDNA